MPNTNLELEYIPNQFFDLDLCIDKSSYDLVSFEPFMA